jgi:outer membrane biosynthesis protein TonB
LIRKASILTQRGDLAAAKAVYAQTGTTADQCSLIDSSPRLVGVGGTFPDEAKMWGFEGWVSVQFDVGADGRTINQRAVISYPPFIFTKAGDDTLKTARYEKAFRPDGGIGCGGVTQRVRFTMRP